MHARILTVCKVCGVGQTVIDPSDYGRWVQKLRMDRLLMDQDDPEYPLYWQLGGRIRSKRAKVGRRIGK